MPWSIDFGSLKIGSDVRFRNGADSHEAAAKESMYALKVTGADQAASVDVN